jgi:hypothetical protein
MKLAALVIAPILVLGLSACADSEAVREVPQEALGVPSQPSDADSQNFDTAPAERVAREIVEQKLREPFAIDLITREGLTYRVVERDGEQYMVTMDYSPQRLNLVVTDQVITEAYVG